MDISIDNHIVMLDEAHNIEDVARSAASLEGQNGERRNLEEAIAELNYEQSRQNNKEINEFIGTLKDFLDDIVTFLAGDEIPVKTGQKFKSDQHSRKGTDNYRTKIFYTYIIPLKI